MTDPGAPLHLVFMGVSGSGKSTVGRAVQERLGWEFAEGDDFHPPENVAKMSEGIPLTDADPSSLQLVALVLAIAAGATVLSHVNDSGFWLVSRFFGMDVKTTLRTWTVMETTLGVSIFVLALGIWAVG